MALAKLVGYRKAPMIIGVISRYKLLLEPFLNLAAQVLGIFAPISIKVLLCLYFYHKQNSIASESLSTHRGLRHSSTLDCLSVQKAI